ncbi:Tripartite motif-containing protein 59 [Holothuria leucospilota]|uniref:Tripartite motif-containing protein 59 n=1 Tax=Holothuria leucospilota TaxID=206669 RepID=A0A9Q1HL80_HOLLE|nr:Tripartite motif-containing protein 59 [Holothuria leucospilota]
MAASIHSSEANSNAHVCWCGICLENFDNPKMLSCGHTFCQGCLEQLATQENRLRNAIPCPQCRSMVAFPPSGRVEDFPTNYAIIGAIERSFDGYSLHSLCVEHKKYKDLFCSTCGICICGDCFARHHKRSAHDVTSMTDQANKTIAQLRSVEKWYRQSQCKRLLDRISAIERGNEENVVIITKRIHEVQGQMVEEIKRQGEQLEKTIKVVTESNKKKLRKMKKTMKQKYIKDLDKAKQCSSLLDQISKYGMSRERYEKRAVLCSFQDKWNKTTNDGNDTLCDYDDEGNDEEEIHDNSDEETDDDDEHSDHHKTDEVDHNLHDNDEPVDDDILPTEDDEQRNGDQDEIYDFEQDTFSSYQPEQFSNFIEFHENPRNGAIAIGSLKSSKDKPVKRADTDDQSGSMLLPFGDINNRVQNWLTWALGKS